MALHGDLATFGLADLLQWLDGARATGTLSLTHEGLDRRLEIQDGVLQGVSYAGQWETLARQLEAAGVLEPAQLAHAMARVRRMERGFEGALGEARVDLQLLPELAADELKVALAQSLGARTGRFSFSEDALEVPGDEPVRLRMSLRELLFDAFRLADEQPNVDRVVGDDATRFTPTPGSSETRLGAGARAVLARVGTGATAGTVRLGLGLSRAHAARQLYDLVLAGRLQRAGDASPVAPDPLAKLLAQGSGLLRAGEYDAAALLCASLRSADPTDRRVREFAKAVETEQVARLYARLLPPCVYVRVEGKEAQTRKLRPTERQVLQLVNGVWDTATLALASPLREGETLKALQRLVEMGLVEAAHLRRAAT